MEEDRLFECDEPVEFADSPVSTRSSLTLRPSRSHNSNRLGVNGPDRDYNNVPHQAKRARIDRISANRNPAKFGSSSNAQRRAVTPESIGSKYLQNALPDELLVKIFGSLDAQSVCRVSQVCHRFHSIEG